MNGKTDLTRWNRAGLKRFRYIDGNAITYLEDLRAALRAGFPQWSALDSAPSEETAAEYLERIEDQYLGERRDVVWEASRSFARATHVLVEHLDTYANEGFLSTTTQWDNLRRLVEMLDYHPAPPASASTKLILEAKSDTQGTVETGFKIKFSPPEGGDPIIFETLEDIDVDAALNKLRPLAYDRNQDTLSGTTLELEGEVTDLVTGEPLVLEDDINGEIRAYFIQGVSEGDQTTEVEVSPRLWHGFRKGYTKVHAQAKDKLSPLAPAAQGAVVDQMLRLAESPEDLLPGEALYITDGQEQKYRYVTAVEGLGVVVDRDIGQLAIAQATVARPVLISVSRQGARRIEDDGDILILRIAGDWSRLTRQMVGNDCIDPVTRVRLIAEYEVFAADYTPAEANDPDAGYTNLRVSNTSDSGCTLINPQNLYVSPVGFLWPVDTYLEKVNGHLPDRITTSKPKKTTLGDLAVVARGSQASWGKLRGVSIDLDNEQADLTVEGGWADRGGGDWFLADTTVYSHFDQQLRLDGWQQNDVVLTGNEIPLASVPAALIKGRRLIVQCDSGCAVLNSRVERIEGQILVLEDDLGDGCTYGNTIIQANIVSAGHGESKPAKVLGSGDATSSNQAFVFATEGISFVADASMSAGVRADIEVKVDGKVWQQVSTLNDADPTDSHYTAHMTQEGYLKIGFGDGQYGRRLPSGTNNVRIGYRKGNGLRGNVDAGSLVKPLKPHPLIESVSQPEAATGGNDTESASSLRDNAPASLLTLERAVSLTDFGNLATSQSSVWQARAFARQRGVGRNENIEVVVVPAGGGELGDLQQTLQTFLLAHAIPGVAITITPYQETYFDVRVILSVDTEGYDVDLVSEDVRAALEDHFSLENRKLGQDVFRSEVFMVVEEVTGVLHSEITLSADGSSGQRRILSADRAVRIIDQITIDLAGEAVTGPDGGGTEAEPEIQIQARRVGRRGTLTIQGLGPEYRNRLASRGIRTIADLLTLDPDQVQIGIGNTRLWELKTKAVMLNSLQLDFDVDALNGDTLLQIVDASLDQLTSRTAQSATRMRRLQDQMRRMQVILDEEAFAQITLGELLETF